MHLICVRHVPGLPKARQAAHTCTSDQVSGLVGIIRCRRRPASYRLYALGAVINVTCWQVTCYPRTARSAARDHHTPILDSNDMSMRVATQTSRTVSSTVAASCRSACIPRPRVAGSSRPITSRHISCRAEGDDRAPADSQTPPAAAQEQQKPTGAAAPSAPLLKPGQGTAIVTGAISVIFGIAYLVLVQLLDLRGGELQPPPPEAYIP